MKYTLLVANPAHLSTTKNQLVITHLESNEKHKISIEDVGVIILEHPQITITHVLISKLLGNNTALVTCDAHHLPQGLMLSLNTHHTQQAHFQIQIAASHALKAQLWKQTIQAKIKNQAALLKQNNVHIENMTRWASKVKAGDPDNFEARAANYYWENLFKNDLKNFKRGRHDESPNHLLNYGYAILRAVIARSLVGSGLLPTLGYHHHNQYNAYCLADDVMEPYRPWVDQHVLELIHTQENYTNLNKEIKKILLQIPILDVCITNKTRPLMLAAQQTTRSLYKCYAGHEKIIEFPVW